VNQKILDAWAELKDAFPDMGMIEKRGDRWVTSGRLPVVDQHGDCWEVYGIDLALSDNFPLSLPSMWETGGKIRRTADWHVYTDGSCCVGTEARQYFILEGKVNLLRWVQLLAVPYLANHKLRTLTGTYSNGERSHGGKGIYEEYDELFRDRGKFGLLPYLKLLGERSSVGRNDPCFCGKGGKYKYCFLRDREGHRQNIPAAIILRDILTLERQ
jgi:hypothetical protein